jgi:hypothetical protein
VVVLLLMGSVSCSGSGESASPTAPSSSPSGSAASPSGGPGQITASAADLAFCVQEVNRYRATVGIATLSQQAGLEASAAQAAQSDHQSGEAHGWFRRNGTALAENQAPRWSRASSGNDARTFISRALQAMWAEGPGGGHHENMRGRFTATGCAVYSDATTATFVQHFR